MPEIVNPYIAGNPVTGTEMFFGREDVFEFIQKALTGQHRDNVIVLYGQRRTGKTSVMYQMSRHLNARYLCIFIDLSGLAMEGLGGLLWELANYIQRTLKRDHQIDLPRLSRADFMADPRSMFENDFLGRVWSAIGDRHILLMLDEAIRLQEQVQAGRLEKEVFEYLRHLMQAFDRLNFLFSLGSGLEEMEKEYAFLFSVGLYKKISFLERDAATALITQPVKDYYQVAPAAIERILRVTSGHAYYTQLLCHSLFNRWQQQRQPQVQATDVNAILDEGVERGLAVLKHIWEESTSGEKAVLAGLAACMGERNHPVGLDEVNRVWAQRGVTLPPGVEAKAIQSLLARDIIVGQSKYAFTVDLQRLWALKYERVEWVKEEISEAIRSWGLPPKPDRRNRAILIGTGGVLLFVISLVVGLLVKQSNELAAIRATATFSALKSEATATAIAKVVLDADATRVAAAGASVPTAAAAATRYQVVAAAATAIAEQLAGTATADAYLLAPSKTSPTPMPTPTPTRPASPTPTRSASPTPAGPTPIAVTTALDLLAYARSARWYNSSGITGLWLDTFPESSTPQTDRGFATFVPRNQNKAWASGNEIGNQTVLETHPQAAPVGEIRGEFRLKLPAQGARFSALLEFLQDAVGSDGVHVEIWWSPDGNGGDKLAEAEVGFDSPPVSISADLGRYGGQTGVLQLRINPKTFAGADWLTWRDVKVTPK